MTSRPQVESEGATESSQKVALVTGASGGIGQAIALHLARDGLLVAVHYNEAKDAAEATVRQIRDEGGQAFALQADLASVSSIDQMFLALDEELSRRNLPCNIDVLVNNAGVPSRGIVEDLTEEAFDKTFDINVKGAFFVARNAIPRLRDGGRVINISSSAASRILSRCSVYSASKGAIESFTRVLASELAPRHITANAVAPGGTDTNFLSIVSAAGIQRAVDSMLLGRLGQPDDIARVVRFLAGPDGGWVTAQVIHVNGGERA